MMRNRHPEWLPTRDEIEDMLAEHKRFEEDALKARRTTLFELCAARYLPGVTEYPLFNGRTLWGIAWARFPRRLRGR